jgi:hypothetical protein
MEHFMRLPKTIAHAVKTEPAAIMAFDVLENRRPGPSGNSGWSSDKNW